jgi:Uma2 family endonuclease
MQIVPVLTNDEIQEDRPMPSLNHARIAQNLSVAFSGLRDRFTAYPQLTLNLSGWSTIPDLAIYPAGALKPDWLSDREEISEAPAVIIEILSPKQNFQPLLDKVRNYLKHGVKSCWIVVPGMKSVSIYPAAGGSRTIDDGVVRDDVSGIEIPHSAIFA